MENKMKVYISQLDEFSKLEHLVTEYGVGLEVVMFANAMVLDDKERYVSELREYIHKVKEISFHGPFSDLIPGSNDPEIRRVANMRFTQGFQVAKQFKAKRIVYHTGCIPHTYWEKQWLEHSKGFWKEFTQGKLEEMEIHIENVYDDDYILMGEIIDEVNNPNFSACLDIGHVNTCSSKSIDHWIKGLNKRVKHVHLHNNEGVLDNHNGLSNGKINMVKTLEMLKLYCPEANWAIEVFDINQLAESLKFLKNLGFL